MPRSARNAHLTIGELYLHCQDAEGGIPVALFGSSPLPAGARKDHQGT